MTPEGRARVSPRMGGQRINYDFMPELARTESPTPRQASPQPQEEPPMPPLPLQSYTRVRSSRDRDSAEFTPLERNDGLSRLNVVILAERSNHDQTKTRLRIAEDDLATARIQIMKLEAKIVALELSLKNAKEEAALMAPTREPAIPRLSPRAPQAQALHSASSASLAKEQSFLRDKSPTAPAPMSSSLSSGNVARPQSPNSAGSPPASNTPPATNTSPRAVSPARARAAESNPLRIAGSLLARLQGQHPNRSPVFQRSSNLAQMYSVFKTTGELPNCVAQAMIYLAQRALLEDVLRDVNEVPLPFESVDRAVGFVDDVDFTSLPDGKASAVGLMMRLLGETRDDDPVFKPELITVINLICEQPFKSTLIDSIHTLVYFRLKQHHHRLLCAYMKLFHALYKRAESAPLLARLARGLVPYLMPDAVTADKSTPAPPSAHVHVQQSKHASIDRDDHAKEQRTSPSRAAEAPSAVPPRSPRGTPSHYFDMIRGKFREEKKEEEPKKSPPQFSPYMLTRDASSTNSSTSSNATVVAPNLVMSDAHIDFVTQLISEWTLVENISKRVRVYFNEGKPVLRAADFDSLIDKLLSPVQPDAEYAPILFVTHAYFSSSPSIFRAISERIRPVSRSSAEAAYNTRIETALQYWFASFAPQRDPSLLPLLSRYLELHPRALCSQTIADFLRELPPRADSPPPPAVAPKEQRRVLTLGPEYLSMQMTLVDSELFNVVPRSEIISITRNSGVSPHFAEMVKQFSVWASWVANEVLGATDLKERVEVLSLWIKVARLCFKMGNFNTPYAILSGLSFAAISRLSATWRAVPGKRLRRFHELEQLYTPHSAYRNLRAAMQTAPLPGVPYIGLYSKWMAIIDESNTTFIDGLINVQKMDMIYKIWRQVQSYQTTHYNYPYDPELRVFMRSLPVPDQDALYARSIVVEPQAPLSPRGRPGPNP